MSKQANPNTAALRSRMHRSPVPMAVVEKATDPRRTLASFLPILRPYRLAIALVFVMVVIYTLLSLAGPYLMGLAIDRYMTAKDVPGLAHIALLMLVAYALSAVFQLVSNWIMAKISQRALKSLRRDLFEHMQTLPQAYFDNNPAGGLMSRLTNDIDAINHAVSQNVTSFLASLLSMVGIVIAMFALNAWLALGSVLVLPVIYWFTQFVAKYTRRGFRDLQKSLGELNAVAEEAVSGQKIIKAFRRNDAILERFREQNEAVYHAGVYANSYALLLMPVTGVLGNFFVIVLSGLGGYLALQGLVSVGVIATFINYGQNFIAPLRQVSNLYNSLQAALAGAERVLEMLNAPSEIADAPDARALEHVRGAVVFEDVSFGYIPDVPVIRNLNLEAHGGETIALVGPTGAGKTTIIQLLTRFYEIDSGRISVDGTNIRDLRKDDLRQSLGLVLQDTFLFSDTVMENIRFGRLDATDEECMQAAKLADADHFIRRLPQGYQTLLSERAGNLSQGQRQLLSIARAILADPAILILDEATSSVDTRTEARIQKGLLELMKGRTAFVIAHRLSTIRDADNVVVIEEGRVVQQGTHDQLLQSEGLYRRLYLSQFKGHKI